VEKGTAELEADSNVGKVVSVRSSRFDGRRGRGGSER